MRVKTIRDVMAGHRSAEIRCLYTGNVVRRLEAGNKFVLIDAMEPPIVRVPLDTPVRHEPWVFDRGNVLFAGDATGRPEFAGRELKLCGVHDPIRFEDGTTDYIDPVEE